jgi:hypothetical protein
MAIRRSQRGGERGAALIEAALITPIFFSLIFGILEFGLLFRNSLTTHNAGHEGARSASVSGRSPDADYLILRSVEHGLAAMGLQTLDYVIVFKASGPNATVPTACLTASQTYNPATPAAPACNRYTAADFFKEIKDPVTGVDSGNFHCGARAVDRYWCPTVRVTNLATGPDYVGVAIETRHQFITGLFGAGRLLHETTIIRLEPDAP